MQGQPQAATDGSRLSAPLFDDNPATFDLLGYDAIARAISATVRDPRLNPITVGVNSPWGGGKSTVLKLVERALRDQSGVILIEIDPWEFVDSGDPRGTLISRVLDELSQRVAEADQASQDNGGGPGLVRRGAASLVQRLDGLRRRIVWSKVATTVLKSAVTLSPDLPKLVDALTPQPVQDTSSETPLPGYSAGMAGFRSDFEQLLADIPDVERVVVLVDDLDRCLPPDILGSLEAIKLFLSVKRMAFVLAADEDLLRSALASEIGTPAAQDFASRYTEKIVQLPFSLPRLSKADAQAYITLLLCSADQRCMPDDLTILATAAAQRRSIANAPYVIASEQIEWPIDEHVRQAHAIANGLAAPEWSSPRAIKRFLNNFAVRAQIARAWGAPVDLDVLIKLWIFEHRDRQRFNELAKLSEIERPKYLRDLEDPPDGHAVPDDVVQWATDGPLLSEHNEAVTAYLTLAAAVITNVTIGGALSDEEAGVLARLVDDNDAIRRAGQLDVKAGTGIRRDAVLIQLAEAVMNPRRRPHALESLQVLSEMDPAERTEVLNVLMRHSVLMTFQVEDITSLGDYPEVLTAIVAETGLPGPVRDAARDELADQTH